MLIHFLSVFCVLTMYITSHNVIYLLDWTLSTIFDFKGTTAIKCKGIGASLCSIHEFTGIPGYFNFTINSYFVRLYS